MGGSVVVSKQREDSTLEFIWLGSHPLPANLDLRQRGWVLIDPNLHSAGCVGLVDGGPQSDKRNADGWSKAVSRCTAAMHKSILIVGIDDADERALLLQMGFGDVIGGRSSLGELAVRARRIAEARNAVPRWRVCGDLRLDLFARDAFGRGKPLNLNPREFALLWKLAEGFDQTVTKQTILNDVWRLQFVPVTNSIAVHMSRLRRKLALHGFDQIIETVSEGGYRLRAEHAFL